MEIYQLQSLSRVVSTRKLTPDWLHESEQPIRSQDSKLTQLLTMTTTHKFPHQPGLDSALVLPRMDRLDYPHQHTVQFDFKQTFTLPVTEELLGNEKIQLVELPDDMDFL